MKHKSFVNRELRLRSAIAMLLVFYISNSGIFGFTYGLGPDAFIAQLLGFLLAAPLLLILARLAHILPGKNLYHMLEYAFGRWIACLFSAIYFLYFISLAATIRVQYAELLRLTTLVNTPLVVILLAFFAFCAYLANSGLETIGKWSVLLGAGAITFALTLTFLAIPHAEGAHLLPIGVSTPAALVRGGGHFAIFPLGEAVVMLALLGRLEKGASPYKLFFFAPLLALGFFLLTFLRNTAILGASLLDMLHFPSINAASVVQIGWIGGRVDVFFMAILLLTGLTKAALCLIAGIRALRQVFSLSDETRLLLPVAFFSVGISAILFSNLPQLLAHPAIYVYYAPIFQVVIPGATWLVAEFKLRQRTPTAR